MALADDINGLPTTIGDGQTGHLSNHQTIHAALKDHGTRLSATTPAAGGTHETNANRLVMTGEDGRVQVFTDSITEAVHATNKLYVDTTAASHDWVKAQLNNPDANTVTTPGMYHLNVTSSSQNLPMQAPGNLEVFGSPTYLTQRYTRWNADNPQMWVRIRTGGEGGTWSAWREIGATPEPVESWLKSRISNVDFNTITTQGIYPINLSSGGVNMPARVPGTLEVFGDPYLTQRYTQWSSSATPRMWVRSRTSAAENTWTTWFLMGGAGETLRAGDDANTAIQDGTYSVLSVDVANLPVSKIGRINTTIVGGNVMQEFLSVDLSEQWNRAYGGTTWTEWRRAIPEPSAAEDPTVPNIDIKTGGASIHSAGLHLRDMTVTPTSTGAYPSQQSLDGTILWNSGTALLKESRDGGQTWTTVWDFERGTSFVREMSDGEIIVRVGGGTALQEVWRSTGYGTPDVTFDKVMEASHPGIALSGNWGFDMYGDRVLVAEYGPREPQTAPGEWARYVYQSLDGGKTWSTVLDLADYLNGIGRTDHTQIHLHGVCYDPYWDRLWVTYGDYMNGLIYSDDNGETWETGFFGPESQSPWQGVHVIAMPDCILIGSDGVPNGLWRVDRRQGRNPEGGYEIVQAYALNDSRLRTHLCQQAVRVPGANGKPDLVLIGFSAETNPGDTVVVGTWDGYGFSEVYRHHELHDAGKGLRNLAFTPDGTVFIGMDDGANGRLLATGTSWTVAQQAL